MLSFQLALIPFLLSASTVQAKTPDNVSSRLMIHVSSKFAVVSQVVPENRAAVESSTDST